MLVLSRKQQQQIKIGDQITISILRVKGNTVRVGIEAPREVRVVRGELPKESESATPAAESLVVDLSVEASGDSNELSEEHAASQVIAFRVKRASANANGSVSADRLPLGRIHDRFGAGPLKQLVAACSTLAK